MSQALVRPLAPQLRTACNALHRAGDSEDIKFIETDPQEFLYISIDDHLWDRAILASRQLALAVADENYSAAARLKIDLACTVAELSPARQRMHAHLQTLKNEYAPLTARRAALMALHSMGDMAALPGVCSLLGNEALALEAEAAACAIRSRAVSPAATDLCRRGCALLVSLATFKKGPSSGSSNPLNPGGASNSSNNDDEITDTATTTSTLLDERETLAATAASLFTSALEEDPRCAMALAGRGAVWYSLERYESAVEDLESALALDPWLVEASRLLALSRGQLKQFSAARGALWGSVQVNPALIDAPGHKATLSVLGRWEATSIAWKERYLRARKAVDEREAREKALERSLAATSGEGEAAGEVGR